LIKSYAPIKSIKGCYNNVKSAALTTLALQDNLGKMRFLFESKKTIRQPLMDITLLKGKLHMATVTQAELWYDGSYAIDKNLVNLSGLREFEKIKIYNVANGERFSTYVILADAGSGTISMNGPAARKVQVGDQVIIAAYGQMPESEADSFAPKLVYLDKKTLSNAQLTLSLYKFHRIMSSRNYLRRCQPSFSG
jgi:aspartate 1-decarboxylase